MHFLFAPVQLLAERAGSAAKARYPFWVGFSRMRLINYGYQPEADSPPEKLKLDYTNIVLPQLSVADERQASSELDMQSQRLDGHGSPVGVVGRIADALKIEGHPAILERGRRRRDTHGLKTSRADGTRSMHDGKKIGLAFLDRFVAGDDPLAGTGTCRTRVSVTTLPRRGVLKYRGGPPHR